MLRMRYCIRVGVAGVRQDRLTRMSWIGPECLADLFCRGHARRPIVYDLLCGETVRRTGYGKGRHAYPLAIEDRRRHRRCASFAFLNADRIPLRGDLTTLRAKLIDVKIPGNGLRQMQLINPTFRMNKMADMIFCPPSTAGQILVVSVLTQRAI